MLMLLDFVCLPAVSKQEVLLNYSSALKKIKYISTDKIMLGLVYHQILKDSLPVSAKELGRSTGFSTAEIFSTYKKLRKALGLPNAVISPAVFLNKICSNLKLSQSVVNDSEKLLRKINFDFSPMTKIAVSIYISSRMNSEKTTQKKISDECCISIQTLRTGLSVLRQAKTFNKGIV